VALRHAVGAVALTGPRHGVDGDRLRFFDTDAAAVEEQGGRRRADKSPARVGMVRRERIGQRMNLDELSRLAENRPHAEYERKHLAFDLVAGAIAAGVGIGLPVLLGSILLGFFLAWIALAGFFLIGRGIYQGSTLVYSAMPPVQARLFAWLLVLILWLLYLWVLRSAVSEAGPGLTLPGTFRMLVAVLFSLGARHVAAETRPRFPRAYLAGHFLAFALAWVARETSGSGGDDDARAYDPPAPFEERAAIAYANFLLFSLAVSVGIASLSVWPDTRASTGSRL